MAATKSPREKLAEIQKRAAELDAEREKLAGEMENYIKEIVMTFPDEYRDKCLAGLAGKKSRGTRKASPGKRLGRPPGSVNKKTKEKAAGK